MVRGLSIDARYDIGIRCLEELLDALLDEIVLVLEVIGDDAGADAGLLRDVIECGLGKTAEGNGLDGGVDDLSASDFFD